ncbi:ADP-ribosylation factor-like protein [Empedobacter falsenii]
MFTILILPFIPLIWTITGFIALFGGYKVFKSIMNKLNDGDKLLFLGMPVSGKTYMLTKLRNEKFIEYKSTHVEKNENFSFKVGNKTIYIDVAKELGGEEAYRGSYEENINESKVLIFMFDIQKYLSEEKKLMYRRECNSRLSALHKLKKENAFYIGTHIDKINKTEAEILKDLAKIIKGKDYEDIMKRLCLTNLTDDKEFEKLKNNIFGKS